MNATATISVKTTPETKKLATELADRMGTNLSNVINMMLRQMIMEQRLPFRPRVVNTPDRETMEAIDDSFHGRNQSGPYKTMKSFHEAMDRDD